MSLKCNQNFNYVHSCQGKIIYYVCTSSGAYLSCWLVNDIYWDIKNRAGTIQSLSVHYRYRNQPISIDTVIMLFLYR